MSPGFSENVLINFSLMNDEKLVQIIGCLSCFDMTTGRLVVFEKAQVIKMEPGNKSPLEFRIMGEDPKEKEYLLISHNGWSISRVKKEHVDII